MNHEVHFCIHCVNKSSVRSRGVIGRLSIAMSRIVNRFEDAQVDGVPPAFDCVTSSVAPPNQVLRRPGSGRPSDDDVRSIHPISVHTTLFLTSTDRLAESRFPAPGARPAISGRVVVDGRRHSGVGSATFSDGEFL